MGDHKTNIGVYLRLRPTKQQLTNYSVQENDVVFTTTKEKIGEEGAAQDFKEHPFRFDGIFESDCSQESVFDTIAKPILLRALDGFNGTLFAYGQTGSGKTFTITGGDRDVRQRGIIPRSLAFIFREFAQRTEYNYAVNVSYLEIYNDKGYDLLSPKSDGKKDVKELPRVFVQEDENSNIHMKNLSAPQVASEEEALNRLFAGDLNRMVTATPMNAASSR